VADGFIWGRGALDAKVGVICLLEAAAALLAEGYKPQRTLLFAFGHDEEVGGWQGAGERAGHHHQALTVEAPGQKHRHP